ncbi:adp-sugar pyrophosphatase [Anaeramoeba flamelloides]|uniref:Adp-sugar pyrophosphatase n=1 Tax=Anaeramoeba flamelloides TaxID=1746091 RepID=A0ABQ8Z8C8_9EUKA|nr:adp-sugar pyrophosphatase [Anaeramoeba flamelloides]
MDKTFEFCESQTEEFCTKVRAVVVVIATVGNKLILIEQKRHAVKNRVLEFPAGLVDDLDPETCALHETKEETGYERLTKGHRNGEGYASKRTGG